MPEFDFARADMSAVKAPEANLPSEPTGEFAFARDPSVLGVSKEEYAQRSQAAGLAAQRPLEEQRKILGEKGFSPQAIKQLGQSYQQGIIQTRMKELAPAPLFGEGADWSLGNLKRTVQDVGRQEIEHGIPFRSWFVDQPKDMQEAQKRVQEGTASNQDLFTIAKAQRSAEEEQGLKQAGLAGDVIGALRSAPAIMGEYMAGGRIAKGVLGDPVKAGFLRTLGTEAGRMAIINSAMPSQYMDVMRQKNVENGRAPDSWEGLAPAWMHSYAQLLVLNRVFKAGAGAEPGIVAGALGAAKTGATGALEMGLADTATNFVDNFIPKAYKISTGHGTFEKLMEGDTDGALRKFGTDALTLAAFTGLHRIADGVTPAEAVKKAEDVVKGAADESKVAKEKGEPPNINVEHSRLFMAAKEMDPGITRAEMEKRLETAGKIGPLMEAMVAGLPRSRTSTEKAAETGATAPPEAPKDAFSHMSDVDVLDLARFSGVTVAKGKKLNRETAVKGLLEKGVNPAAFGAPEPPASRPLGKAAPPTETPSGSEIGRPERSGASEKPTEHYYRTPDSKGAEDNVDAAVRELVGDQFAGKWFSRTFEGNQGYKGHVQLEFRNDRLGAASDVVNRGEKDVQIGGAAPMYMHPGLRAVRYRGAEDTPQFKKLKEIVDTANQERAAKGIEPIELLTGKAAKAPRVESIAAIYDRAAKATAEDIANVKSRLDEMSAAEVKKVAGEIGMVGKVSKADVLARIEDRRNAAIRRGLVGKPSEERNASAAGVSGGGGRTGVLPEPRSDGERQVASEVQDEVRGLAPENAKAGTLGGGVSEREAAAPAGAEAAKDDVRQAAKDAWAALPEADKAAISADPVAKKLMEENGVEFGKPMTSAEKRTGPLSGGSGLGEGGAEIPMKETALANARTDAERVARGLPPLMAAARQANVEVWDRAMRMIERDPNVETNLINELAAKPRVTSVEENALLLHRRIALSNEFDRAMHNAAAAVPKRLPKAEWDVLAARADSLLAEIDRLDGVINKTGTEAGRAFQFRAQLAREDFSLSTMMGRTEIAKGTPLTPEEKAEVVKLHDEIKAADAEVAAKTEELGKGPGAGPGKGPGLGEGAGPGKGPGEGPGKLGEKGGDLADAIIKARKKRAEFAEKLDDFRYAALPVHKKVIRTVGDTFNAVRSIITAFDLSAVFRQGGFIAASRPMTAIRAIPEMLRSFGSEQAFERAQQALRDRPNAIEYAKSGLYLADTAGPLTAREEAFVGRWTKKIPGVAASERAYNAFLNRVRADVFDSMTASLARTEKPSDVESRAIANFINVSTGRGPLGATLDRAAVPLATLFFSPRFVVSRFQILTGQPLFGGTGRTRGLIAQEYGRVLAGLGIFYAMNSLNDDAKITFDPRSSDFGKIRFGNTRVDPLAGLAQSAVFVTRLVSGETKNSQGKLLPLRDSNRYSVTGKVPYGGNTVSDVIDHFVRSKLAPVPGAAGDILAGKNVVGEPTTAASTVGHLAVPMSVKDVYKSLEDQGVPRGAAIGLLAILGMGTQTYEKKRPGTNKQESTVEQLLR